MMMTPELLLIKANPHK